MTNLRWICFIVASVCGIILFYNFTLKVQFENGCSGHLMRAANASSIEIAKEELNTAIKYADENRLTSGSTHILYVTPAADIGYWYKNLKSAQTELQKVGPETSQLEQTNILMKLRETLTDQSKENGTIVTMPNYLYVYPNHRGWFFIELLAIIFGLISVLFFIASLKEN